MTTVDLTAATEAACRVSWNRHMVQPDSWPKHALWDDAPEALTEAHREEMAHIIAAAAPLIEAAVRERVAEEIERFTEERLQDSGEEFRAGHEAAASLVRGEV